jgi:hypothetical protein
LPWLLSWRCCVLFPCNTILIHNEYCLIDWFIGSRYCVMFVEEPTL